MPLKQKQILVLVNPKSGYRKYHKAMEAAGKAFSGPPWRARIHLLTGPRDLPLQVKRAVKEKAWAVVVCGGDGTLNGALAPLIGGQTRLGLIPMGTGNGFARSLGLPFDPEKACRVIAAGKTRKVDVGVCGGAAFVNIMGAGLDAWIAQTANRFRFLTRASGFARYLVSGVVSLFTYNPPVVRASNGTATIEKPCLVVAVANASQYGMGVSVCPDAVMDDGRLDLVFLEPVGFLDVLRNFPRLYNGKPLIGSHRFRGTHFDLAVSQANVSLPFHVEGEPAGMLPVSVRIRPKSLRVLVP